MNELPAGRKRRQAPASLGFAVGLPSALLMALLTLPFAALAWRWAQAASQPLAVGLRSAVASAVILSLATTAVSMTVILIVGTPLAYAFARYRFPLKRIFNALVELPIVMPPVVAGLALLMTFGRRGILGPWLTSFGVSLPFTPAAIVIVQVFVSAPFYVRAAQSQFEATPRELEESASIDGATPWRVFWEVTLPLSARGIVAGLVLSWARALGEFGATILFAGNLQGRTQTMPLLVYSAFERDLQAALWAGLILIGTALLALGLAQSLGRSLLPADEASPADGT